MARKATWSLLLLLLVNIQAFASACDVRCGTMAYMNSAGQMVGTAHCQGMASRTLTGTVSPGTSAQFLSP